MTFLSLIEQTTFFSLEVDFVIGLMIATVVWTAFAPSRGPRF